MIYVAWIYDPSGSGGETGAWIYDPNGSGEDNASVDL